MRVLKMDYVKFKEKYEEVQRKYENLPKSLFKYGDF